LKSGLGWQGVATDLDGSFIIAGGDNSDTGNGRLWISTDYGATFAETQPAGDVDRNWHVDCDSDGSFLVAAAAGGRIYTSANGGSSWTERTPGGSSDLAWEEVAVDNDGSFIIAAIYDGRLYTSANSGGSWTERKPTGANITDRSWYEVNVSTNFNASSCVLHWNGTNYAMTLINGHNYYINKTVYVAGLYNYNVSCTHPTRKDTGVFMLESGK